MCNNVNIKTDGRLLTFANQTKFPGWYFDINGCYCCVVNNYLISIFINDCDNTMDITVDTIGEEGFFDLNIEWETPSDEAEMTKIACKFMKKYGR